MYLIYITAHIRKSNEMNFRLTEAKGHPTYLMMNIKQSLEKNNALKMEIFTDKIKQKKTTTYNFYYWITFEMGNKRIE